MACDTPASGQAGSGLPPAPPASFVRAVGPRLLVILLLSVLLGRLLDWSAHSMQRKGEPAGLWLGVLHGALMPCTLPAQLAGQEVDIYASHNLGRRYKLGYVLGVNVCGAIFFGFAFRRWHRWRQRLGRMPSRE